MNECEKCGENAAEICRRCANPTRELEEKVELLEEKIQAYRNLTKALLKKLEVVE